MTLTTRTVLACAIVAAIATARVQAQPVAPTAPLIEMRGVWMPVQTLSKTNNELEQMLDSFAAAKFNTIFLDVWARGYVTYPDSEIVPQLPALHNRDAIGFIVREAHERDLQVHLWFSYGFYAYFTKDALRDTSFGPILDATPSLSALDAQGNRFFRQKDMGDFYSLCPANPESHQILAKIMVESLAKYPADGVQLDRIRFPGPGFCYCEFCKKRFRRDVKHDLEVFEPRSELGREFVEWKRNQTTRAVATFVREIRRARPGLPVTSYVVNPQEMNSKAQGWDLWMKDRLLNAVAVSMYDAEVRPILEQSLPLLGNDSSRLICAISAERANGGDALLRNINTSRAFHSMGQIIWYSDEVVDDIPALKSGPYVERGQSPFLK